MAGMNEWTVKFYMQLMNGFLRTEIYSCQTADCAKPVFRNLNNKVEPCDHPAFKKTLREHHYTIQINEHK